MKVIQNKRCSALTLGFCEASWHIHINQGLRAHYSEFQQNLLSHIAWHVSLDSDTIPYPSNTPSTPYNLTLTTFTIAVAYDHVIRYLSHPPSSMFMLCIASQFIHTIYNMISRKQSNFFIHIRCTIILEPSCFDPASKTLLFLQMAAPVGRIHISWVGTYFVKSPYQGPSK